MVALDGETGIIDNRCTVVGLTWSTLSVNKVTYVAIFVILAVKIINQISPGITLDTVPALDRRTVDAQAAAHADVLVKEVSAFDTHGRRGTEPQVQYIVTVVTLEVFKLSQIEVHVLAAEADTHGYAEKRRILDNALLTGDVAAQQPLALEKQIAKSISQFGGHDTDAGSREHVAYPVTVVQYAHHTRSRSHTIASHRIPGRSCHTIFFVQDSGTYEGRGRVARGP